MISDVFKYSLDYSLKDKISFIKISLLSILSFLIIPFIIIEGYCYRIIDIQIKSFINANDSLPKFNNFKKFLIDGLKIITVNIIYSIPFVIVLIFGFNEIINVTKSGAVIDINSGALIVILLFIIGFISFLFSKVAIVHMVYKKSFKSAFKIREILNLIGEIKVINYLTFFIGFLILNLAIFIVFFLVIVFVTGLFQFNQIEISFYFFNLGLDITILILAYILLAFPFIMIFESRAIASMYNLRE